MREMEHSQYFESSHLKELQFKRLKQIIKHAYETTAYYKRRFDECGIHPCDLRDERDISKLPLLTKSDIREHGPDLISKDSAGKELIPFKTGGSTGKPVTVYYDYHSMEQNVGSALRAFRWSGWDLGEPVGRIWGNPPEMKGVKDRLLNLLIEPQIFLDTMRLDPLSVAEFATEWKKLKPTMLHGHSHSIYMFARYCNELGIDYISPKSIVSTSMMLLPSERLIIEGVFNCKVTNLYGCEEVSLIASECERHAGMHINMENNYIELIDSNGNMVEPGKEGAIIATNLNSWAMPVIRYKLEDVGILSGKVCPCGRKLPILEDVRGRFADFLVRQDGSLVAGVSLVERTLTAFSGIDQMQIVQEDKDSVILNIVKGADYTDSTTKQLRDEFQSVFGPSFNLVFKFVDVIKSEQNGKYRFSISKVENTYKMMQ
jgi:phenylacetate-CoA ligase